MFIKLAKAENYRGKDHAEGDVIEVGGALGERLILNGHTLSKDGQSTVSVPSTVSIILSDEQTDTLKYKAAKALILQYEIETADNKFETYKAALKAYFSGKRG